MVMVSNKTNYFFDFLHLHNAAILLQIAFSQVTDCDYGGANEVICYKAPYHWMQTSEKQHIL